MHYIALLTVEVNHHTQDTTMAKPAVPYHRWSQMSM